MPTRILFVSNIKLATSSCFAPPRRRDTPFTNSSKVSEPSLPESKRLNTPGTSVTSRSLAARYAFTSGRAAAAINSSAVMVPSFDVSASVKASLHRATRALLLRACSATTCSWSFSAICRVCLINTAEITLMSAKLTNRKYTKKKRKSRLSTWKVKNRPDRTHPPAAIVISNIVIKQRENVPKLAKASKRTAISLDSSLITG
mmetsp:Transcript_36741/g.88321  ORF Transcript_36741/g.88321 Transcript_36741/m.88321 type:complete len:202 (+) Transcript_36741:152-757(+)